jgi:hypothetical protein
VLLDASPAARRFSQPLERHRPTFVTNGRTAYFKFDGENDFLLHEGQPTLSPELTVFILAAPKANAGTFPCLFSTSTTAGNDFTHGMNIDFGRAATTNLSVVNVEAAGASGERDLLVPAKFGIVERPFGGFHLFSVRSKIAKQGIEFSLDGVRGETRERHESLIGLDRLLLGSRYLSHDAAISPQPECFFQGDIATLVVYNKHLSNEEKAAVELKLLAGVADLHAR